MKKQSIKPIPKYILDKIKRLDLASYPEQKGANRFYSYLTSMDKELVKITVAVKNHKKQWYIKQVAAHGVKSDRCLVRDMEYVYMGGMGFKDDLERFFSYLEKQKSDPFTYLDYLRACEFLGLDMTVDKNRFPHDFKRWHDIRIDEYSTAKALSDKREQAELYSKFQGVAQKYAVLQGCRKGDFAVVIAKSPAELMHEGEALKHCVGRMGYDQKMVREETLIFFVRAKEQPDTPFVTVEYSPKSKKVLQCYGLGSKRPDEAVMAFVDKVWLPFANRKIQKLVA